MKILTGLVTAGEALALVVAMYFLSEGNNPWISVKNELFLMLDFGTGLGLVYVALAHRGAAWLYILYTLAGLAGLIHGYLEWEYLAGAGNPYCANAPLFIVNTPKTACGLQPSY